MPNAKAHDAITVVTGLALAPLTYLALLDQGHTPEVTRVDTALLVGAHLLSGIMFSPDLDIDSAIDDRWGPFYWLWRPYMWVVPHGHWFSHALLISPLLRLLYFFVAVSLVFVGLAWALGRLGIVVPDYHLQVINYVLHLARTRPREALVFLIGFIIGGAAHTIADWLVTDRKHY